MIVVPVTSLGQEASWHALLDLREELPEGWVLVGGQMVHLHAAERGYRVVRPTDDADAVLDVKLRPSILHDVTAALVTMGFDSAGVSASGVEHRWQRGEAQIDVLIPQGLGERLRARVVGVSGSPTVETPAGQIVVDLSEVVDVQVGDRVGHVRRPTLLGALIAKAAADTTVSASSAAAGRHREDFVTLSAMLKASDLAGTISTKSQRRYVAKALKKVSPRIDLQQDHPTSRVGLARLTRWVGQGDSGSFADPCPHLAHISGQARVTPEPSDGSRASALAVRLRNVMCRVGGGAGDRGALGVDAHWTTSSCSSTTAAATVACSGKCLYGVRAQPLPGERSH